MDRIGGVHWAGALTKKSVNSLLTNDALVNHLSSEQLSNYNSRMLLTENINYFVAKSTAIGFKLTGSGLDSLPKSI